MTTDPEDRSENRKSQRPLKKCHPLRCGDQLGNYRLLEVIGRGGVGDVFLAEHIKLSRRVAIKVLHCEYFQDITELRRFILEARAANRIQHDNIIDIHDLIEDTESGAHYIVMDYLKGESLADRIYRDGPISEEKALRIAKQVASALQAAHEKGIVHRDLKPGNVFLTQAFDTEDFVKIIDFGIAKLLESARAELDDKSRATREGTIVGTPAYLSPEQAESKNVDHRADIYGFGVLLYEMLTAQLPFEGTSYGEIILKHLEETPVRPSLIPELEVTIDPELEEFILRCLEKSPDDRPQSMEEVIEVVEHHIAKLESSTSTPVSETEIAAKPKSVISLVPLVVLGVAALTALVLGLVLSGTYENAPYFSGTVNPGAAASSRGDATIEPRLISIRLETNPSGAEVTGDDGRAFGLSPLDLTFETSARPLRIVISKNGYQTLTRDIILDHDQQLLYSLLSMEVVDAQVQAETPSPGARGRDVRTRMSSSVGDDEPTPDASVETGNADVERSLSPFHHVARDGDIDAQEQAEDAIRSSSISSSRDADVGSRRRDARSQRPAATASDESDADQDSVPRHLRKGGVLNPFED